MKETFMSELQTTGITGTDGVTPVYNPSERWRAWALSEIYTGGPGQNRYVPKIKDYVEDIDLHKTFQVVSINPTTLIAVLKEIQHVNTITEFTEIDLIMGVGPGTASDTYRMFVNSRVIPYSAWLDPRSKVPGSMVSYVKVFLGADLTPQGNCISKTYDQNGEFVSLKVPVELAGIINTTNYQIKVAKKFSTTVKLEDGETVTAVYYDDDGHVVHKRQFLVENTDTIGDINDGIKYITHVTLESPFMSLTTDGLIEFPMNIPVNALDFSGRVHYSDGTSLVLPVDGTKFKLHGMDTYVGTIQGKKIELVLAYSLSSNERSINVTDDKKHVTSMYNLRTTAQEGNYTVKLYGYPVFINAAIGYRMDWYLHNGDRNTYYNVSPYVTFNDNTGGFDPKAYGYLQRTSVKINLSDVSGSFKPFIHVQTVDILLKRIPNGVDTPWNVGDQGANGNTLYGEGLYCTVEYQNGGTYRLNLSSAIVQKQEWMLRVYQKTYPLFNKQVEDGAPVPNRVIVECNGATNDIDLNDWSTSFNMIIGSAMLGKNVYLHFYKKTATGNIFVSTAALPIKLVS